MSADDEHALIARIRAGHEAAWPELFALTESPVRARIAGRLPAALRRKVSADDVMQEARLVAFRRIAEFEDRGDGAFGAWFGRIAERKLAEAVRHWLATTKRGGAGEVSRGARPDTGQFTARGRSPSKDASAREERRAARRALESLAPDHREVLRLVQYEGLTLGAAAERMGRSREAAKKLYARALAKLAQALEAGRASGGA